MNMLRAVITNKYMVERWANEESLLNKVPESLQKQTAKTSVNKEIDPLYSLT